MYPPAPSSSDPCAARPRLPWATVAATAVLTVGAILLGQRDWAVPERVLRDWQVAAVPSSPHRPGARPHRDLPARRRGRDPAGRRSPAPGPGVPRLAGRVACSPPRRWSGTRWSWPPTPSSRPGDHPRLPLGLHLRAGAAHGVRGAGPGSGPGGRRGAGHRRRDPAAVRPGLVAAGLARVAGRGVGSSLWATALLGVLPLAVVGGHRPEQRPERRLEAGTSGAVRCLPRVRERGNLQSPLEVHSSGSEHTRHTRRYRS